MTTPSLPRAAVAAACLAAAPGIVPAASAAFTTQDIRFWIGPDAGPGIATAVLVVSWDDGQAPLAWGYRWNASDARTGYDLLAAVIGADPRLTLQGLGSGFISNVGFDADLNGTTERFRPGYDAQLNAFWGYWVNNAQKPNVYTSDAHILPPLGNPYDVAPVGWVSSNTGIHDRPLVDGSWDAFYYHDIDHSGPGEPVAALPVPEPGALALLGLTFFLTAPRWNTRRSKTSA